MTAARPSIEAFVAALPKVELHVHLVGSASLDTVLALARRYPDSGVPTDREALHRFYTFTGFDHFLTVFGRINQLVRTEDDVRTIVAGLAADLAAHAVRYAEVQVTPLAHLATGMGVDALADGLAFSRGSQPVV